MSYLVYRRSASRDVIDAPLTLSTEYILPDGRVFTATIDRAAPGIFAYHTCVNDCGNITTSNGLASTIEAAKQYIRLAVPTFKLNDRWVA